MGKVTGGTIGDCNISPQARAARTRRLTSESLFLKRADARVRTGRVIDVVSETLVIRIQSTQLKTLRAGFHDTKEKYSMTAGALPRPVRWNFR
jgi:hypothetical protein